MSLISKVKACGLLVMLTPNICEASIFKSKTAYDFTLEPETGSVWIGRQSRSNGSFAEWKIDGQLINYAGAFNLFNFRDPRISFGDQTSFVTFEGKFAVFTSFRGIFTRNENKSWNFKNLFAEAGFLGCAESPSSSPCITSPLNLDSRGQQAIFILDQNNKETLWYWTGSNYRPANAIEKNLYALSVGVDQVVWAEDGSYALALGDRNSDTNQGGILKYNHLTATANIPKQIEIINADFKISFLKLLRRDGRYFAMARARKIISNGPDENKQRIYEITNILTEKPAATLVWEIKVKSDENKFIGFDKHNFYYFADGKVYRSDLNYKLAEKIYDCDGNEAGITLKSPEFYDSNVYWTCGNHVLTLQGGAVHRDLIASQSIAGGNLLFDNGIIYDVALTLFDGSFERQRSDSKTTLAKLLPIAPPPVDNMFPVWDEPTGACGVAEIRGLKSVYCQEGGRWLITLMDIGVPSQVFHSSNHCWALSKLSNEWVLFIKPKSTSQNKWKKFQSWKATSKIPKFLPHGTDRVAIDFGEASIWTLLSDQFQESHKHDRIPNLSFSAALDVEGNLYEPCGEVEKSKANLCLIQKDGKITKLDLKVVVIGKITPLKRGLIYSFYGDEQVIRGTRTMELGKLYGQFSRGPNENMSLTFTDMGSGEIVIESSKFIRGEDRPKLSFFTFDGIKLTPSTVSSPRFLKSQDDDNFTSTDFSRNIPQVWRGQDGVWRSIGKFASEPISYGESAIDSLNRQNSAAPNFVNHSISADNQVLMATDDGLWQCAKDYATNVTLSTFELKQTKNCARVRNAPFLKKIFYNGKTFIAQQGPSVVVFSDIKNPQFEIISSPIGASSLGLVGDIATWIEGSDVVSYNLNSNTRETRPIPAAEVEYVKKVAGDWLCSLEGLFYHANSRWQKILSACVDISGNRTSIATTDGSKIYICKEGQCSAGYELPKPYMQDSVLGTMFEKNGVQNFAVVLGKNLYEVGVHDESLTDITPIYAKGSLILTSVSAVNKGVVSLNGGGVIVLPGVFGNQNSIHLRIE